MRFRMKDEYKWNIALIALIVLYVVATVTLHTINKGW